MELIEFNNEYYDPYNILKVDKYLSTENKDEYIKNITKRYRKLLLKYHPDKTPISKKEDYKLKFIIINKSFNYIIGSVNNSTHQTYYADKIQKQDFFKLNDEYNNKKNKEFELFDKERKDKISKIDVPNIIEKFTDKKFSLTEFNKLFEHINTHYNDEINLPTTLDGFSGYNTETNLPNIYNFNGLMITYDNMTNYDKSIDYKDIYYSNNCNDNIDKIQKINNIQDKKIKYDSLKNVNLIYKPEQIIYNTTFEQEKFKIEQKLKGK